MKLTEHKGIDIEVTSGGEFFACLPIPGTTELARTPAATVRDLQKAIDRALARKNTNTNLKAALLRTDGQAVMATRVSTSGDLLVQPAALRYNRGRARGYGYNHEKYYPSVEGMAELLAHRNEISAHLQAINMALHDVAISQRHGYGGQSADEVQRNTERAGEAIAEAFKAAAAGMACPAEGCNHD
jgi:hypothetical protein